LDTVTLRPDDFDPQFSTHVLVDDWRQDGDPHEPLADFGSAVQLVEATWLSPQARPGETVELMTRWQVIDPTDIGPLHPPAFQADTVFFTHLLDEEGNIVSQRDALDAPSWSWQAGDTILQIHQLELPAYLAGGIYQPFVGIYDRPTGDRLPIHDGLGPTAETVYPGPALEVAQS
jgi:hypothetical protein